MDDKERVLRQLMDAIYKDQSSVDSQDGCDNCETTDMSSKCPEENGISLGISNRHVHLSQNDVDSLFGKGYELKTIKELSQPGYYACSETVHLIGPKGKIEKVRILGPVRPQTQVEILRGDCYTLGIKPEVRISGNLQGSPGVTIRGPRGSINLEEGLMVAQRHIHLNSSDAARLKVVNGDNVKIACTDQRGGVYNNVVIRVNEESVLECHLDTEEANAMNMNSKSKIIIIR